MVRAFFVYQHVISYEGYDDNSKQVGELLARHTHILEHTKTNR